MKKILKKNLPLYAVFTGISLFLGQINNTFKEGGFVYYSAVAKAISESNFWNALRTPLDAYGFQSADKPPLGVIFQGLLGKIFSVNNVTLTLPSQISIILISILTFKICLNLKLSREGSIFGALAIILAPIAVMHSRVNLVDSINTLFLTLAILLYLKYLDSKKIIFLFFTGISISASFLTKSLFALPTLAIITISLFFTCRSMINHKMKGLSILLVSAIAPFLSWIYWFDNLASNPKPRVVTGGSQTDLIFIVNGIGRLVGEKVNEFFNYPEYRETGFQRFFSERYIDSWVWLSMISLIGIIIIIIKEKKEINLKYTIILTIFTANATMIAFSGSTICCTHPYYTLSLLPIFAILSARTMDFIYKEIDEKKVKIVAISIFLVLGSFFFSFDKDLKILVQETLSPIYKSLYMALFLIITILIYIYKRDRRVFLKSFISILFLAPSFIISLSTAFNPLQLNLGGDQRVGRGTYQGVNILNYREVGVEKISVNQKFPNGVVVENVNLPTATASEGGEELKTLSSLNKNLKWKYLTLESFTQSLYYTETGDTILAVGGSSGNEDIITYREFLEMIIKDEARYFILTPLDLCRVNPKLNMESSKGNNQALILDFVTRDGIRVLFQDREIKSYPTIFKLDKNRAEKELDNFKRGILPKSNKEYISGIKNC